MIYLASNQLKWDDATETDLVHQRSWCIYTWF